MTIFPTSISSSGNRKVGRCLMASKTSSGDTKTLTIVLKGSELSILVSALSSDTFLSPKLPIIERHVWYPIGHQQYYCRSIEAASVHEVYRLIDVLYSIVQLILINERRVNGARI